MPAYKTTGAIGYLISAIICVLWLTVFGLMYAAFLYPVTIILRTIGWYSVAGNFKRKLCYITSIVVLILGLLIFFSIVSGVKDVETLKGSVILWIIYSLLEFISYGLLIKYSKFFVASLSSIIGIIIMINFVTSEITDMMVIYAFAITAVPFLLLSSIASFIGFLKAKPPESTVQVPAVMPTVAPPVTQEAYIVCPNCKRQIPSNSRFCPFCGFKIKA